MKDPLPPVSDSRPSMPMFRSFPGFQAKLPHVSMGSWPTPIERLDSVCASAGMDGLFVKRDDKSNGVYGGNKVRKLEFLLAAASRDGAREVLTFGFAGSNHALATAVHARRMGLGCCALLLPQANAHYVRRNLLAGLGVGAALVPCASTTTLLLRATGLLIAGKARHGIMPHIIPAGGSCPRGAAGYVNAAFELKEQIAAGLLPEPDVIYVPLGSSGTAVGLTLGLMASGLRSRVVAVRVVDRNILRPQTVGRLFRDTAAFLHRTDPAFAPFARDDGRLEIREDYLGDGYARFTRKGMNAAELMRRETGIVLNGTYSAKAFAALLDDAAAGRLRDRTALFWNTYNSRDLAPLMAGVDFRQLPRAFHRYFENDVQAMDGMECDR